MAENSAIDEAQNYNVKLCVPGDLTKREMTACIDLVTEGEAVGLEYVKKELPLASILAIARIDDHIVGVGAIKRTRRDYAAKISRESGVTFPRETPELGYVAVAPDHQGHGLSHRLAGALLAQHKGRLFSTTYNDRMKQTLEKAGFVKRGKEWKGREFLLSFWHKR